MFIDTTTRTTYQNDYFLRAARHDISFPAVIDDAALVSTPIARVLATDQPVFDVATQGVRELPPEFDGTAWRQAWEVYSLAGDEAKAARAAVVQQYTDALAAMLDAKAQEKNYDNRISCALRAGYPGPFNAEGSKFAAWMDTCNALGYQVLADVNAGKRPRPTLPEFLALMPALVWPA